MGPACLPIRSPNLSAARNLYAGRGFVDFTGQPLTNFPPGFPAALASVHFLGFSLSTSARLINAASFAAIVGLAWILLRRHTSSQLVIVGATLLVATSSALVRIADNAWSEPMFCALVLAFLLALEDATRRVVEHRGRWLALAGLLAAMAFLVRYAAAALIIVGVIVILTSSRREPRHEVLRRFTTFGAAAGTLPGLWALRNATSGTHAVLGPRVAADPGPLSFAERFFNTFLSLFSSSPAMGLVVLGSVAVLAALALFTVRRSPDTDAPTRFAMSPLVAFVAFYAAFVIFSGKYAGASVNERINSPIYVPALVVAAFLFDRSLHGVRRLSTPRWRRPLASVLVVSAVGYLGVSALSFAQDAWADGRTGRGYATPPRSPLWSARSRPSDRARSLPPTDRGRCTKPPSVSRSSRARARPRPSSRSCRARSRSWPDGPATGRSTWRGSRWTSSGPTPPPSCPRPWISRWWRGSPRGSSTRSTRGWGPAPRPQHRPRRNRAAPAPRAATRLNGAASPVGIGGGRT